MSLEKEILLAKGENWARIIAKKCGRIAQERQDDLGLWTDILNGTIYSQAQMEFCHERACGLYDSMNMPIEYNK